MGHSCEMDDDQEGGSGCRSGSGAGLWPGQRGLGSGLGLVGAAVGQVAMLVAVVAAGAATGLGACGWKGLGYGARCRGPGA